VVSKAGDWTADTIQNPPAYLWKRAVLMRGVGYGMRVFNRIIIVTTGSGIGPCLGFLGDENRPLIKVIWQTRTPVKTYGQGVMDLVHQMGPDPIIFDTSRDGRVDMLPTVRQQVTEFGAEAVFVISNPAMTKKVIYEFESQGIPAYGPIFDS
jgi:NAD(P)H-flavin reductase